jgi:cellulose synthase/poly-beta-1,6-N-acetylglucosamine synthase-like glycosyltransferase
VGRPAAQPATRHAPGRIVQDNTEAVEIAVWRPVLHELRIPPDRLKAIDGQARRNATSLQAELLASGICDEHAFFRAVARVLELEFAEEVEPDTLVMRDRDGLALLRDPRGVRIARLVNDSGRSIVAVAPDAEMFRRLRMRLDGNRGLSERLRVATPSELRRAVERRCRYLVEQRATGALFDALPYCSSRMVLTGLQGFACGSLIALGVAAWFVVPHAAAFGLHLVVSLFFFGCVALRLAAIGRAGRDDMPAIRAPDPSLMPRYSVLVALYREAEIVPELLQALGRLIWPRSKLEIKLVCEADDRETIAALEAHGLRPWVEIIRVPRSLPRTKPKALAHALQLCSGDYVALYDAEDKPHPLQLVEAWQHFEASDKSLACVQAPLVISNGGRGMIPRMFAFEYSGLFRGILPFLSANSLILPLGGTSNHFRRGALEKMGGWDPYNVTEDADLGLRMCRFGYRTETIRYPTYEIAPENWLDWRNQRTRWFKGWIQTWLVHMRDPRRLAAELGFRSFWVTQILFAGMVMSALVHPLLLVTIVWLLADLATGGNVSPFQPALIGLDLANIGLGYTAFFLLGRSTLRGGERRHLWKVALFTPVYWFMQSIAAWRAVWQLRRDPHLCALMYQRHQAPSWGGTPMIREAPV